MYPECTNPRKLVWIHLFLLTTLLMPCALPAQGVNEIITDYNGWWKSSHQNQNPVKPDNSHNLLAFRYNGVLYATGVNDSLLAAHGEDFVSTDIKALPVYAITGAVNSNTKIGLGAMYDGVAHGPSAVRPVNNMNLYLTDGIKGLDLGTCVANLPAGNIFLPVTNLKPESIGDNVPDLLITQIADPATSSLDRYEFTDINGNRIGNTAEIVLNNLKVLGHWTADFYEASTNPMQLTSSFTHTDRPIRLWAADFSEFGITQDDLPHIAYFKIRLNGNSDMAFVAYNDSTFNVVQNPLPVTLSKFQGRYVQQETQLTWQTLSEQHASHFIVEASTDGTAYAAIGAVQAAGASNERRVYHFSHRQPAPGKTWYRLQIADINGSYTYSEVITVQAPLTGAPQWRVYPNPASEKIWVQQTPATTSTTLQVRTLSGVLLLQQTIPAGNSRYDIDIHTLPAGTYFLVCSTGTEQTTARFTKQ